jgi:ribulose-5-phosphate 4-epimerase/fuculose-1-phosphate aldolase
MSKEHQSIFNLRRAASTFAGSTITFGSDLRQHRSTITLRSPSFETALWLAVEVETLAKMYVHALAIGEPPHVSEAGMA